MVTRFYGILYKCPQDFLVVVIFLLFKVLILTLLSKSIQSLHIESLLFVSAQ